MDQRRFDDLTRLLGASGSRRSGLRAALGGLLGVGAGAAALDADARRRRHDADADRRRRKKRCKPACTDGFDCVKVGKKRECQCLSGVTCGATCCAAGQSCQDGQCAAPPPACIAFGEACKDTGRVCCDNLACASGQGGEHDVACYVRKTGTCRSTAECVYGTRCEDGRCVGIPQPPNGQVIEGLGTACNAAQGDTCAAPGAVCGPYTDPEAPAGDHCALPLEATCLGDPQCTCYRCFFPNGSAAAGSRAAATSRLACCGWEGNACQSDRNCCLGTTCVGGTCTACELTAVQVPFGPSTLNLSLPAGGANPSPQYPVGIAFLPDGRMLVNNGTSGSGSDPVRFIYIATDQPGTGWEFTDQFAGKTGAQSNEGLAVGAEGEVYVVDNNSQFGVVQCWRDTAPGTWEKESQFGSSDDTSPEWMDGPIGVAIAADGRVFVAENSGEKVSIWRRAGAGWEKVGEIVPSGPGTINPPAVALARNGDCYVSENKFSPTSCVVTAYRESGAGWNPVESLGGTCGSDPGEFESPYGVAFFGPYLLVVNQALPGFVSVWSEAGGQWTQRLKFGNFQYPWFLATGPDGLIYVADTNNSVVSRWRLECAGN